MAGLWSVFVPESGQNLITNPSLETNTTNWTAVGGTIARSAAAQFKGAYSLAVTPTAGTADGCYFGTITLANGTTYTFTVWVKGVNAIPYQIYFASTVPAILGTPTTFVGTGNWQKVSVTWTENVGAARRLYVVKNNSASVGVFYVDAAQCEAKSYQTSYIDGDQEGCLWDGLAHGSTATRDSQTRAGGREYNFDAYNFFVSGQQGTGVPPLNNIITPYGLRDGGLYQSTIALPRTLVLTGDVIGSSLANLLASRASLIDALKSDAVAPQQPFLLRYNGNTRVNQIKAIYDDGLGLNKQDSGFTETDVHVRMIAPDPAWFEEGEGGALLTAALSLANSNGHLVRSPTGTWSVIGTGPNAAGVRSVIYNPYDGNIYIAGSAFATYNGVANTVRICKYDPRTGTISAMGTGAAGGDVYDLCLDTSGNVVAVGDFTSMGGVANTNHIALWSISGSTWSSIASAVTGSIIFKCIIHPQTGDLYVAGNFTNIGGVAMNYVGYRTVAGTWTTLGSAFNAQMRTLAFNQDGTVLYAGGDNTAAPASYLQKYTGGAWSAVGSAAPNNFVWTLLQQKNGLLLIGGDYTTIGGISAARLAAFNGQAFTPLGSGAASTVARLYEDRNGLVYVCGSGSIGGLNNSDGFALWNGSTFLFADFNLPGTSPNVRAVNMMPDGTLHVGWGVNIGSASTAAANSVTNTGKSPAYPKIKIINGAVAAQLVQLANYTTKEAIYFNLTINVNETVLLDLTPGARSFVSDQRGDISWSILSGSNDDTFHLAPGANNVNVFVDIASVTCTMWWRVRHLSIDGAN